MFSARGKLLITDCVAHNWEQKLRNPDTWKLALVRPLLKKVGLEPVPENYRPVSNLQYTSKLPETVVAKQLYKHLSSNNLLPVYQST